MEKIIKLNDLSPIIKKLKKNKNKIILCHGVFDLLHVGHIKHLKKAKELGDKLIVTITADKYVNKGPGKPVFNQELRAEALSSIQCVDYVSINENATAIKPLSIIKPNIYCKGKDYKNSKDDISGQIKNELAVLKKNKGKVLYTHELTFSSSRTINTATDFYSKSHKKIVKEILKHTNFTEIKRKFQELKKLKILVIGETILDEYIFCEAIGKSGKEPILVLKEIEKKIYLGGILSIANNLSQFSNNVSVISMIGDTRSYSSYIKKNLSKKITLNLMTKKNSPTILKRRFIDAISKNKIFGVYDINDDILEPVDEKKFNNKLNKEIKKYDLVVVSDYGHGLISRKSAKIICKEAKFLALNAQVNAFNVGYHTMKNYEKFNTLIINEREIRHELRDKTGQLNDLIKKLSKDRSVENLVVTKGSSGSILYNKKLNKFFTSEAYAKKVIDKIGAGDTMLAIIALCLQLKMNTNLSLLISSLAAAQSVGSLANEIKLDQIQMLKTLENILKH